MQRWRELTADEEVAAVTALRELAGGRADLLAEVADLEEDALEGEPDEPLARQAAKQCREAGADESAIPHGPRSAASRGQTPTGGERRRAHARTCAMHARCLGP
jgi:hypothetical protein